MYLGTRQLTWRCLHCAKLVAVIGLLGIHPGIRAQPDATDKHIQAGLHRKLSRIVPELANAIRTRVENGVVTLFGVAPNLPDRHRVENLAATVAGVTGVRNQIRVADSGRSDRQILQDIQAAFEADAAVPSDRVEVSVRNGVVTLSGTVHSYADKWIAGKIAANVAGLRNIQNRLILEYVETRPDSEILADIKSRLAWDKNLQGGRIQPSIRDGRVSLKGSVNTPIQKMWARYDAWVAGVKDVDATGLLVRNTAPRGEKFEEIQMTDSAIRQAINNSFLYHPELSMSPRVWVDNGIVTLSGKVDTARQKRLAAKVASEIAGVRQVKNQLQVTPGSVGRGDIVGSVTAAFKRDPYVENNEIYILANHGGDVTLTGFVDSDFERLRAQQIAEGIPGVRSVTSALKIRDPNPVYYWESGAGSPEAKRADLDLLDGVMERFSASPYVDADNVNVEVRRGIVTLTGSAPSVFERKTAESNAYEAGAQEVINRIVITGETTGQVKF